MDSQELHKKGKEVLGGANIRVKARRFYQKLLYNWKSEENYYYFMKIK